jgi:hypothetical protein
MDITQLLKTIDLHVLAENAGARFNGRHSSRCPLHNGNNLNAFHIYYGQDGIMRYHCFTNCPEGANGGNAINFYMRWRQVDFKTAVDDLSRMFNVQVESTSIQAEHIKPSEIDPAPIPPSAQWKSRAAAFVSYAHDKLWNDQRALCYLMGRGLIEDTIGTFNLGYNPRDLSDRAERWGLDGKPIWLSSGIVIPHSKDGSIWFVNIRRPSGTPKYMGPRGGVRGIYHGPIAGHPVLLLAEGEFDTPMICATWPRWVARVIALTCSTLQCSCAMLPSSALMILTIQASVVPSTCVAQLERGSLWPIPIHTI